MTENFNFRDLGPLNSRKFVANRLKQHMGFLSEILNNTQMKACREALQKCIDRSNNKITNNELIKVNEDFVNNLLIKGKFPKLKIKNTSSEVITKTCLLLNAIENCCSFYFDARRALSLINGYAAIYGAWSVYNERAAQIRAYNRYMQKKRQRTIQKIEAQQPNVLYPNRQISLGEQE